MESIARRLVDYWMSQRLPIAVGCSAAAVTDFERRASIALPEDMREYFLLVNGMIPEWPGDQDEKGFSFWPLERVRWVPEELAEEAPLSSSFPDAENFYAFADYLGWSWAYAIRLSGLPGPAPVILIGKDTPELVASSFSEFVDLYLVDSPALYGSPSPGPTR